MRTSKAFLGFGNTFPINFKIDLESGVLFKSLKLNTCLHVCRNGASLIVSEYSRASECKNGSKSNPQVFSEDKPMLKLMAYFLEWELLAAVFYKMKNMLSFFPLKYSSHVFKLIEERQMVDEANRNRIGNSSRVTVTRWHSRGGDRAGWMVMALSVVKTNSYLLLNPSVNMNTLL